MRPIGKIVWYWRRDEDRIHGHDPSQVWDQTWVRYGDSVAEQFEYHRQKLGEEGHAGILEMDVEGLVTSTKDGTHSKAFAEESGTICE